MLAAMSVNPLAGLSGCNKPVQAAKEKTRDGLMNNDQLSLTNPRDALHHGERAANKQGGRSMR